MEEELGLFDEGHVSRLHVSGVEMEGYLSNREEVRTAAYVFLCGIFVTMCDMYVSAIQDLMSRVVCFSHQLCSPVSLETHR